MGFGIAWQILKTNRLAQVALAIAVLALLIGLYTWKVRSDAQADFDRKAQEQIDLANKADAAADAVSAEQAVKDTAAGEKLELDLKDAYAKTPDQAPSTVRLVLACRRLCYTAAARTPEFSARCGSAACPKASAHN